MDPRCPQRPPHGRSTTLVVVVVVVVVVVGRPPFKSFDQIMGPSVTQDKGVADERNKPIHVIEWSSTAQHHGAHAGAVVRGGAGRGVAGRGVAGRCWARCGAARRRAGPNAMHPDRIQRVV